MKNIQVIIFGLALLVAASVSVIRLVEYSGFKRKYEVLNVKSIEKLSAFRYALNSETKTYNVLFNSAAIDSTNLELRLKQVDLSCFSELEGLSNDPPIVYNVLKCGLEDISYGIGNVNGFRIFDVIMLVIYAFAYIMGARYLRDK